MWIRNLCFSLAVCWTGMCLGAVTVSNMYTMETNGHNAAVYGTITNTSGEPICLVRVDSDAAQSAELHTHTEEDGVMRMQRVSKMCVPANGNSTLQQGGDHIMLINSESKKAGDRVPLTLRFDDGTETKTFASVIGRGLGYIK